MSQVFLCYSLLDEREAAVIREQLGRYGLNVWWDAELSPGKRWAFELSRALDECDTMIVLVSPHSMASDLVKRELDQAISTPNFEDRVFPVVIQRTLQVPGYFKFLPVFDVTKNRKRGLRRVADAIKTSQGASLPSCTAAAHTSRKAGAGREAAQASPA